MKSKKRNKSANGQKIRLVEKTGACLYCLIYELTDKKRTVHMSVTLRADDDAEAQEQTKGIRRLALYSQSWLLKHETRLKSLSLRRDSRTWPVVVYHSRDESVETDDGHTEK